MAKVGRPPKVKEQDMPELVRKFEQYVKETEIPIIAEFAYQNGFGKDYIYDRVEFSELRKIAMAKKEAALEFGALKGLLNPTQAIFSLKQMGWTDKQHIDSTNHNMNTDATKMEADERRARIDELNRRRGIGVNNST